jgi:hypothetical protein
MPVRCLLISVGENANPRLPSDTRFLSAVRHRHGTGRNVRAARVGPAPQRDDIPGGRPGGLHYGGAAVAVSLPDGCLVFCRTWLYTEQLPALRRSSTWMDIRSHWQPAALRGLARWWSSRARACRCMIRCAALTAAINCTWHAISTTHAALRHLGFRRVGAMRLMLMLYLFLCCADAQG